MRMHSSYLFVAAALFCAIPATAGPVLPVEDPATYTYVPPGGYVGNKEMAIAIALIVATPVYGKSVLDQELPFRAVLKDGIWIVTGTLPPNKKGGTLELHISKQTGQIVRMLHWK